MEPLSYSPVGLSSTVQTWGSVPADFDAGGGSVDLAAIYRQHRLPLVRLAYLLLGDHELAEDVTQDAFAGLQGNSKVRPSAIGAYLRVSVLNGSRSALRRRYLRRSRDRVDWSAPVAGADSDLILSEESKAVAIAVRKLPVRQREVIILRYWSGLSEVEIADAMNISNGAVKSQASRALTKLKHTLEGQQ